MSFAEKYWRTKIIYVVAKVTSACVVIDPVLK